MNPCQETNGSWGGGQIRATKNTCFGPPKGSLGGVCKYFYFHPYLGKIPMWTNIFQMG